MGKDLNEPPVETTVVRRFFYIAFILALMAGMSAAQQSPPTAPKKELPLPGEVFGVEGHTAFLIPSDVAASAKSKPWVWYAPTLPGLPAKEEEWMFERFLAAGIAIAGIDVGESYGSPAGRKLFSALHAQLERRSSRAQEVTRGSLAPHAGLTACTMISGVSRFPSQD